MARRPAHSSSSASSSAELGGCAPPDTRALALTAPLPGLAAAAAVVAAEPGLADLAAVAGSRAENGRTSGWSTGAARWMAEAGRPRSTPDAAEALAVVTAAAPEVAAAEAVDA